MWKTTLTSAIVIGISLTGVTEAWAAVPIPQGFKQGVVASDHPLASQAGLDVLKRGGNAIDAAIATSFVLSVVRNQSTGIGGGGFMLIHTAKGENLIIDSREIAPLKAHRDMYLNSDKKPIEKLSTVGYKAAGVPGLLAGLDYAATHYGSQKISHLMEPAIRYARQGFKVDPHFARASEVVAKRGARPELQALFFDQGKPKKVGDLQTHPVLAQTLERLAQHGIQDFYTGEISRKIVSAMSQHGGLISAEDLAQYRPQIREPLRGTYRGYDIVTMPPPSSGGVALLEMLNFLRPYPLGWNSSGFGSSKYIHLVTEAMKHAFSDRANYLGDPAFVNVPVEELTSQAHADALRKKFHPDKTLGRFRYGKKGLSYASRFQAPITDAGTTHYSVMDKYGNVVAATETINTYFGSQVVIPGTGILLNNEMDDFSKQPGVPNAFGLIGNEANAIAPRKKPLSSMTPTLVLKDGQPVMAVGASGGPRIITGTLQAILNVVDFGMNVNEAVSMPRFHHQWVPEQLSVEYDMPFDVQNNLKAKGHVLKTGYAENVVQAVLLKEGVFTGASDPRKGGAPAGY